MEENKRPVNPRRRKRSQWQIFKEAYLPAIIACAALLLILIFVIGSISRGIQGQRAEEKAQLAAEKAEKAEKERQTKEAKQLLADAAKLASQYDYDGAIAVLDSFSGKASDFKDITQRRTEYLDAKNALVLWDDPNQVVNLSFQLLIADPSRAFTDEVYGRSFNRNFITTGEFTKILQQLYENGYILVRLSDIMTTTVNPDGSTTVGTKDLYLPNGKRPLIITQTNVNYNTYIVDGDGDKLADKDGAGFASRLLIDENGNLSCELINADGTITTGAYDLVPILEAFIETHPDFSYKGARAVLALTGYDGLFGYRTNPESDEYFGRMYYGEQIIQATEVAKAVREAGYEIACYTYANESYGDYSASQVQSDINRWLEEVVPILGDVDILVYAQNDDIAAPNTAYSGDKIKILMDAGFNCFIGFNNDGASWFMEGTGYVRQGRLMVHGGNLAYKSAWFEGIFDAKSVLDSTRGQVPTW